MVCTLSRLRFWSNASCAESGAACLRLVWCTQPCMAAALPMHARKIGMPSRLRLMVLRHAQMYRAMRRCTGPCADVQGLAHPIARLNFLDANIRADSGTDQTVQRILVAEWFALLEFRQSLAKAHLQLDVPRPCISQPCLSFLTFPTPFGIAVNSRLLRFHTSSASTSPVSMSIR
jgi:hypothetical protein